MYVKTGFVAGFKILRLISPQLLMIFVELWDYIKKYKRLAVFGLIHEITELGTCIGQPLIYRYSIFEDFEIFDDRPKTIHT